MSLLTGIPSSLQASATAASRRRTRVLLVEDDPSDASLVREYLLENPADGFHVTWCQRLADALAKAEAVKAEGAGFDVILTDLSLPDSQAVRTIRAMTQRFPTLPVVVLTGLSDSSAGIQAVQEGCQDYLVKGTGDAETLRRTLRHAIERKSIERRLKESEEKFRALVDASPDAILVATEEGIAFANPSANRLLAGAPEGGTLEGGTLEGGTLEGGDVSAVLAGAPDDLLQALWNALNHRVAAAEAQAWRRVEPGGAVIHLEVTFIPITLLEQPAVQLVLRNVTERFEAEREQRLASILFQATAEAMMVTDSTNHIVAVNRAFEQVTGYSAGEVLGRTPNILSSGRHDKAFFAQMWSVLHRDGHWHGEMWNRRKDGRLYVQRLSLSMLRDDTGAVVNHVSVFSDVTGQREETDRLRHRASHDPLTGLPNRMVFHDRLAQALSRARRVHEGVAVLFIDLDGFKPVNDTFGHLTGDRLLQSVARRFMVAVRESDTVARLGGDEFAVLAGDVVSREAAGDIAAKLLEVMAAPFDLGDITVSVGASIGAAFYPLDADTPESLVARADQAMYAAKRGGRGCFRFAGVASD
jgi:diguanylate cyclase (GGDEF)-like protein/PAS domain S-box-containing protein